MSGSQPSGGALRGSVVGLLTVGYLATALVLTLMRGDDPPAAGVEGSAALGLASHVTTWLVVLLVGAVYGALLEPPRGVVVACLFAFLLALMAALWEFDALSAPAARLPRKNVAWLFLLGLLLSPPLGAGLAQWLRRLLLTKAAVGSSR
ncbi:MAG: hypothetical protein DWQ36_02535 [Acidobacteria bacterium]|nr:MAG: hypothetical protein DWQ36_02535 [Acidobacteriota bacterium]